MFNRKKIKQLERDKNELLSIIEIWKRENGDKFSPLASYMYKTYHQLLNDLLNRDLEIRELKRQLWEFQYEKNKSVCVCSAKAAEPVCAEVKIKCCECQDKSEDVFAVGRECWCKNAT